MDLVSNSKLAEWLINEVGEFCLEFCRRELKNFGDKAEFYGTWDDVAGQDGMFFSPELFKKYFLPFHTKIIDEVKKYKLIYNFHICGNVNDILLSLIDAGIDIFDVVQTSARNMEIEKIYKLYGEKVCLHGAIDVQQILSQQNVYQVKEEVKKIIDLWGKRGGIILAPSHFITPETPIENILSLYETINNF